MISYLNLKKHFVLGNNNRLRNFIFPYNRRKHYPLVDDKIKTSELLISKNIPHPKTLGIISYISDMKTLHKELETLKTFVVKPARGATGNGILIVHDVIWSPDKKETFIVTTRKENLRYDEFVYYLSMILSGAFSLSGHKDRVLIQEKLSIHPFFDPISYKGIPDVRVIVFKGFPVMAMVRLPTESSGGRGNLHQGALGCGIDLKTGRINHAVLNNNLVKRHPDYPDVNLDGLEIPHWEEVLKISAQCSELTDIQYLGVDIVLDPDLGPLVLEMNARPGMSIQIANQKGLVKPLEDVLIQHHKITDIDEKIKYSREHF
jgi:alpha-L-glutamate ligase-like protein